MSADRTPSTLSASTVDTRRSQILHNVLRESARVRTRRTLIRAGVLTVPVLALGAAVWLWRGTPPPNSSPPPIAQSPAPLVPPASMPAPRPQAPSLVRALPAGPSFVRTLEPVGPSLVRVIGDDELLSVLRSAGEPSAIVIAGGVTRVVPHDPARRHERADP